MNLLQSSFSRFVCRKGWFNKKVRSNQNLQQQGSNRAYYACSSVEHIACLDFVFQIYINFCAFNKIERAGTKAA